MPPSNTICIAVHFWVMLPSDHLDPLPNVLVVVLNNNFNTTDFFQFAILISTINMHLIWLVYGG
jgi:hypothetical protein